MGYRGDTGDPYADPETGVLKNIVGITEFHLLQEWEGEVAAMRQIHPPETQSRSFDLEHLKAIHRHLFQDVYPWAGELRTIDISKGSSRFGSHLHIENYLHKLFSQLADERKFWKQPLERTHWAERLAHYLGEINATHPFREGNGRTQRLFIGQLVAEYGWEIRWDLMTSAEMLEASIASFAGSNESLAELIGRHLSRI